MTDPTKPVQQIKPEQVESHPPDADDEFDFLEAAENEVVKTRTEEDKKTAASNGDGASEPSAPKDKPAPGTADLPAPADPAQEAVKKRVFELLGKPQGKEQQVEDIAEILLARGKD